MKSEEFNSPSKEEKSKIENSTLRHQRNNSKIKIQNSYSLSYSLPSIRGGGSREAARGRGFKFGNSTSAESRQFNIQNSKINIPIAGLSLSFIL